MWHVVREGAVRMTSAALGICPILGQFLLLLYETDPSRDVLSKLGGA